MRKGKREKVIKSKRWGSEWTREEQRRKGGTPAPRGVICAQVILTTTKHCITIKTRLPVLEQCPVANHQQQHIQDNVSAETLHLQPSVKYKKKPSKMLHLLRSWFLGRNKVIGIWNMYFSYSRICVDWRFRISLLCMCILPTPTIQPPAWVGRSVASVCPRSKRKTAWAINTKLGTHILYSSRSACIDPEVKRSKVKITRLRKPSRSLVTRAAMAACCCCCRCGSACRYDCLCFLVFLIKSSSLMSGFVLSVFYTLFLCLHNSVSDGSMFVGCCLPRSSVQILLPWYLMNGLSNLEDSYRVLGAGS